MIPLAVKVGFSLWLVVWLSIMLGPIGPQNFFWLCNAAMFLIVVALWTENRLILSSQAGTVVLVGIVWTTDLVLALILGGSVTGFTAYMLDDSLPLQLRLSSLYHVWLPPLLLFVLARMGYDGKAWRLQCGFGALMVIGAWLFTEPYRNVNWVHQPFGLDQPPLPVALWVIVLVCVYPVLIYFPGHMLVARLLRRWM